jgi:hypothetical protein
VSPSYLNDQDLVWIFFVPLIAAMFLSVKETEEKIPAVKHCLNPMPGTGPRLRLVSLEADPPCLRASSRPSAVTGLLTYDQWYLNNLWGARNRVGIGLSYRPPRLNSLAELVLGSRFLDSKFKNTASGVCKKKTAISSFPKFRFIKFFGVVERLVQFWFWLSDSGEQLKG